MPRLGNPLVYDFLEVAEALSETRGRQNLRRAAVRRSVSTAYYAVFHALCFVCASELVGWSRSEELEPIYRSVDHGLALSRLTDAKATRGKGAVSSVGAAFRALQNQRHASDYASASLKNVTRSEARAAIKLAKEAISTIEEMEAAQRLRLAILLVARRIDVSREIRS